MRDIIKQEQNLFPKTRKKIEAAKEYAPVPSVHEKHVDYGEILGTGGFCEVRLVSLKNRKVDKG